MTTPSRPLHQLIAWATGPADDPRHRRIARNWGHAAPALAGTASVGEMVRAAWSDAEVATVLLTELAVTSEHPDVATQAALTIMAPRLAGIVGRWARAGVPRSDLEDMEAELIAATLAYLRSRPGPVSPQKIADVAWAQVRLARRRQRRHDARRGFVETDVIVAPDEGPTTAAATVVIDGYRDGVLTLAAAQALWATGVAGWSAVAAAEQLGCHPEALRARRSRAIRALAA